MPEEWKGDLVQLEDGAEEILSLLPCQGTQVWKQPLKMNRVVSSHRKHGPREVSIHPNPAFKQNFVGFLFLGRHIRWNFPGSQKGVKAL